MVIHSRLDWKRSISWVPAIAATANTAIRRNHRARFLAGFALETVLFDLFGGSLNSVMIMMVSQKHAGCQAPSSDSRTNSRGCPQKEGHFVSRPERGRQSDPNMHKAKPRPISTTG
jgi:hypothetical protein